MARWYYGAGGIRRGPVSEDDLRALAADGVLRPSDPVWRPGMAGWIPASEVEGLFPDEPPAPDAGERPPPLPAPLPTREAAAAGDPVVAWEAWQIWVFSLLTLGLFGFYLVPSWARPVERITGKPRMSFGALLALGVVTLGIALIVVEVVYAFELTRHGQKTGRPDSNPRLGEWVLALNAVALVWTLATAGVGFLLGGAVLGALATWLVQTEINTYAAEQRP